MRRLISYSLLIGVMVGYALPAEAAKRVALVIGNAAYEHVEPLANPANDGKAVAAALRRLGFVVIEAVDQDRAGMQALLRRFSAELAGADASLFFYAGHGLQVERKNYLVPVDAALQSEVDLPFEAVAVEFVLNLMEQATPLRLVFLDACRDNPLARRLARSAGQSRSIGVGRGLARMNSGVGTLIAFATEPDQIALDGEGGHSPFARALLEHIETPGLEVRQMLSRVRTSVIESTNGQQLPLDTSALVDEFYFAPTERAQPAAREPAVVTPSEPPTGAPNLVQAEYLFWQSIQSSTDANDFRAYLETFPNGIFAPLARNRLNALSDEPQVAARTPAEETPRPTRRSSSATETVEIEPVDMTMVATRNANLRRAPNADGDPLGVLQQGAEVAVVGKVIGANWYEIQRPDGGQAYVYAPLLAPPATTTAASQPEPGPVQQRPLIAPAKDRASAEGSRPPDTVQTAAVTPGVGTRIKAPETSAGPVPTPRVDTEELLKSLSERKRVRFRISGHAGVSFDRWADTAPIESLADLNVPLNQLPSSQLWFDAAPSLMSGKTPQARVQTSKDGVAEALMVTEVTPEMFGVLLYSRFPFRAKFNRTPVSSALSQWIFLERYGARLDDTSRIVLGGAPLEVAALRLNGGAPASSCFAFVGYGTNRRIDGFLCRTTGPPFKVTEARAVLGGIRVPWFIEP